MIKNVIFDCWSTLLQFKPADDKWYFKALSDHTINKDEIDTEKMNKFILSFSKNYYNTDNIYEIDNIQFFNLLKDTFSLKLDTSLQIISDETLNYLDNNKIAGVDIFLNNLKDDNMNLIVASNTIYSREETKKLINRFINVDFIDIITSNTYGVRKPSPIFFNAILNKLSLKKEETIYVGDSPIEDCYGPYLTGFKGAILILNSNQNPDILKDKISKDSPFKYLVYKDYGEVNKDYKNILAFFNN